ncbi:MAG TPA: NUDIX domain-containing protein [Actinoplanes sp.]|nr:NUDIX domain-containing protein [Actinoplanes sp.]
MTDATPRTRFKRLVTAALTVVPGPDGTVTFVEQLRGPYAGNWLLPGGSIEVGETAEQAARREVAEETGCVVDELTLFAMYEMLGEWAEGDYHLVMFAFRAETPVALPSAHHGHNVGDVRQVRIGELPLHSTDLRILNDAGLSEFSAEEIDKALRADGITMIAHPVSGTARLGLPHEPATSAPLTDGAVHS